MSNQCSAKLVPNTHGARHGVPKSRAAEAATQNVVALYGTSSVTASATIDFLDRSEGSRNKRVASSGTFAFTTYNTSGVSKPVPSAFQEVAPGLDAHCEYVSSLLSPSGNNDVLGQVVGAWLGSPLEEHAADLDEARVVYRKLYDLLIAGNFPAAATIGKKENVELQFLQRIMNQQIRCLLITASHEKTAFVKGLAIAPYGDRFSGLTHWKNVGHVILATVAAPASIVQSLIVISAGAPVRMDAKAVLPWLIKKRLLPPGRAGQIVFDAALKVIALQHPDDLDAKLAPTLQNIFDAVHAAAGLDSAILKAAGLTYRSFVDLELGVSASEAVTFIAIELVKALNQVDQYVAALLAGALPAPAVYKPSDYKAREGSMILRAEGQPDKGAVCLGRSCGADGGLDKENKSARKPLASLTCKMNADPTLRVRLTTAIGIQIGSYFDFSASALGSPPARVESVQSPSHATRSAPDRDGTAQRSHQRRAQSNNSAARSSGGA